MGKVYLTGAGPGDIELLTIKALKVIKKLKVTNAFKNGKTIMCLDKTTKIGYVLVKRGEWKLKEGMFINPHFSRDYNIRQCVIE